MSISGAVADARGQALGHAEVRLYSGERLIDQTYSDDAGHFELHTASAGVGDLSATHGELGAWAFSVAPGTPVDLRLEPAVSITGRTLALDNRPQNAISVQVVTEDGRPVDSALSDEGGHFRFVNLRPGAYRVRCQLPERHVYWGGGAPLAIAPDRPLEHVDFVLTSCKKGRWQNFNCIDGLVSAWIEALCETDDGALWIGTPSGPVRFDGERFETLEIGGPQQRQVIRAFCQTPDSILWVATDGGVLRFDEIGDQPRHVVLTEEDGLASDGVRGICPARDGSMWFATDKGISHYDRGTFRNYTAADGLPHDEAYDIHQDDDGAFWIATKGGVCRYDGADFTPIRPHDYPSVTPEILSAPNYDFRYNICATPQGALWFAGPGGLWRWDGGRMRTYTRADGLPDGRVRALCTDAEGRLWVGTFGGGVSRFDGECFVTFTAEDGLAHDRVAALCRGGDGSLWIGTCSGGVSRYLYRDIDVFATADGLVSDRALSLDLDPDGAPLVATSRGAYRWDGDRFRPLGSREGLDDYIVNHVRAAPDGTAWLATLGGGVWRVDGDGAAVHLAWNDREGRDHVWSTFTDRDGALWLATHRGLGRIDGGDQVWYGADAIGHDDVRTICQDASGAIWAGTYGGGVSRFDGETWRRFGAADGLGDDAVITSLYADDGALWFGDKAGVSRFEADGFASFRPGGAPTLPIIEAVCQTPDGSLWVGTGGWGVWLWDGAAWSSIDSRDGLPSDNIYAIEPGADGAVWLGTGAGLVRYRRDRTPPQVRITGVRTDRDLGDPADLPPVPLGTRITIDYRAVDYKTAPSKRQYRCRIGDGDWRAPTRQPAFEWTPQEAGVCSFAVQAIDRDLNYSEPAELTLHIAPLPHEEALRRAREELEEAYRTLAANNERLQQAHATAESARREAETARNAAESANQAKSAFLANMSHELRTPLNAILGFAQLLDRSERLEGAERENMAIIHRSGEHLLALINDVLEMSRIEAGRVELEETTLDLHELLDSLADMFRLRAKDKGIGLDCAYDECVPRHVRADEGKLRQILINLMGNAVKFTERGRVDLRAEWGDGRLDVAVADTGPGIAPEEQASLFEAFVQTQSGRSAQTGTGLGLAISRQFAQLMGGGISVESEPGVGSTFRLELPAARAETDEMPQAEVARRVVGLAPGQPEWRILIVEDSDENRRLLRLLLEEVGFAVREAAHGEEGVELWRSWRPHLIWMDVRMPVMDGYEATRQIKNGPGGADAIIVALTASVFAEERRTILDNGCDDFLRKPFREGEIFDALATHLGARFLYADEEESAQTDGHQAAAADFLASQPAEWVEQLRQAAAAADGETIGRLLEAVEEKNIVAALQDLVRDFRFDEIIAMTDQAP